MEKEPLVLISPGRSKETNTAHSALQHHPITSFSLLNIYDLALNLAPDPAGKLKVGSLKMVGEVWLRGAQGTLSAAPQNSSKLPKTPIWDLTRVLLNKIPQHQTPGSMGSTCGTSQNLPQAGKSAWKSREKLGRDERMQIPSVGKPAWCCCLEASASQPAGFGWESDKNK